MKDKKIYLLLLLYFLANGVMLLNNGIFWDDWTIIGMERQGLEQQFGENGMWVMTYVHDVLNDGKYAPLLYHWLSFVFLFLAYAFFFKILKQFGFSANSAFLIAALAMVAPYFETKNTAICMAYGLFLALFATGTFAVFRFLESKKNKRDLFLGALLLLLSFFLNSLLLLFLFLLGLYFLYQNGFSTQKIKENWRNEAFSYTGIAVLPFVFWGLKKTFFPITGLYAARGYNEINFSLEKLPKQYDKIFSDNILGLYHEFKEVFTDNLLFGLIVFVLILALSFFVLRPLKFKVQPRKTGMYLLLGTALFLIATFPYTLVNKIPSYIGFDTRHQILLPLGLTFILFAVVAALPSFLGRIFASIVLAAFMLTTINANLNFLRGWVKQEALSQDIAQLNIDTSGVIFITKGLNAKFNATERVYTFYELNGLFKKSLGREDLMIISKKRYQKLSRNLDNILFHSIKFNMKDLSAKVNENSSFQIHFLKERIGHHETLEKALSYYFNRKRFNVEADKILDVSYDNKEQ